MSRKIGILALGLAVSVFFTGCAKQQSKQPAERICVSQQDKNEVVAAAEIVLRDMNFELAKSDAQSGYIRTRPLQGAQFFEFWRKDNVGAFNAAEANCQSIRRTAELKIEPQNAELCIECKVWTERLSLPERETTSTSRAYRMLSKSSATEQKLQLEDIQKERASWVSLGKDQMLAGEILARIKNQLNKTMK